MQVSLHNVTSLQVSAKDAPGTTTRWLSLSGESEGQRFEVVLFADDAKALLLSAIKPHADLIALDHITSMVGK